MSMLIRLRSRSKGSKPGCIPCEKIIFMVTLRSPQGHFKEDERGRGDGSGLLVDPNRLRNYSMTMKSETNFFFL